VYDIKQLKEVLVISISEEDIVCLFDIIGKKKNFNGFEEAFALACTLWSTWLLKAHRFCLSPILLHAIVHCSISTMSSSFTTL